MTMPLALFLIFGVPLSLFSLGFLILMLKYGKSRDQRAKIAETLALAQKLDQSLVRLENRLSVLEDILLNEKSSFRDV